MNLFQQFSNIWALFYYFNICFAVYLLFLGILKKILIIPGLEKFQLQSTHWNTERALIVIIIQYIYMLYIGHL